MSRSNWDIRQLDQKHTRTSRTRGTLPPPRHNPSKIYANRQSIEDTLIELAWRSHLKVRRPPGAWADAWADKETKQCVYAIFHSGAFGSETI